MTAAESIHAGGETTIDWAKRRLWHLVGAANFVDEACPELIDILGADAFAILQGWRTDHASEIERATMVRRGNLALTPMVAGTYTEMADTVLADMTERVNGTAELFGG